MSPSEDRNTLRRFRTGPSDITAGTEFDARYAHAELIRQVWEDGATEFVRRVSFTDLIRKNAISSIFGEFVAGQLTARSGLYFARQPDGRFYLGGVVTHNAFRRQGLLLRHLAGELNELAQWLPDATVIAEIRYVESSGLNTPAAALFHRLGFRPRKVRPYDIGDSGFSEARGWPKRFLTVAYRTEPGWRADVQTLLRDLEDLS